MRFTAICIGVATAASGVGCGALGADPTITGEIRDDTIVLAEASAPQSVWLELTNVGTAPCELAAVLSESPDALATNGERVPLSVSGQPGAEDQMLAYVEVDGEPAGGEAEGPVTVAPGSVARMQLALTGTPEAGERVIICNGPGDYSAGRYVVLAFER